AGPRSELALRSRSSSAFHRSRSSGWGATKQVSRQTARTCLTSPGLSSASFRPSRLPLRLGDNSSPSFRDTGHPPPLGLTGETAWPRALGFQTAARIARLCKQAITRPATPVSSEIGISYTALATRKFLLRGRQSFFWPAALGQSGLVHARS